MHSQSGKIWLAIVLAALLAPRARLVKAQESQASRPGPVVTSEPFYSSGSAVAIRAYDVLRIKVFDVPELSGEYTVSPNGSVSLPLVSKQIEARDRTPAQISSAISQELRTEGLVSRPQVTVEVKKSRLHAVVIGGAVKKPQVYPLFDRIALLDLLAEAGGVSSDAGDAVIVTRSQSPNQCEPADQARTGLQPGTVHPSDKISPLDPHPPLLSLSSSRERGGSARRVGEGQPARASKIGFQPGIPATAALKAGATSGPESAPGGTVLPCVRRPPARITISLEKLLDGSDPHLNLDLHPGDTVTVKHAGVVYVVGAVHRAGGFPLTSEHEQMTVLKAIALAEGLESTAIRNHSLIIRQDSNQPGKRREVILNLSRIFAGKYPDPVLHANDILFIPDSTSQKAMRRAAEAAVEITTGVIIFRR